jgi:hypothetical protein
MCRELTTRQLADMVAAGLRAYRSVKVTAVQDRIRLHNDILATEALVAHHRRELAEAQLKLEYLLERL